MKVSDESLSDTSLLKLGCLDLHGGILQGHGWVSAEKLVASGSRVDTHDVSVDFRNRVIQVQVQSRRLASGKSNPNSSLRLVLVQDWANALGEGLHHGYWLLSCVLSHLSLVDWLLVVPSLRLLLLVWLLVVPSVRLLLLLHWLSPCWLTAGLLDKSLVVGSSLHATCTSPTTSLHHLHSSSARTSTHDSAQHAAKAEDGHPDNRVTEAVGSQVAALIVAVVVTIATAILSIVAIIVVVSARHFIMVINSYLI